MTISRNLSDLANNVDSSGTLGIAGGGTGSTTLTANNVILGNGTSAVQFVAPGTTGNVLTSNGTTWTSSPGAVSGVTSITFSTTGLTPSTTTTGAVTVAGTLVVGNGGTGATTLTGVLKGNGTSAFTAATAGTDYLAPPSGTAILKANSGGALANATAGTDYSAGTSALATGILKSTTSTGALSIAVGGTDYQTAQSVTGIVKSSGTTRSAATAGTDYLAPPSGTALLKANSGGALANAVAATDYVAPSAYASANGLTMATARILGRTTAGTGAAEEITIGSGLSLSAGTLSSTGGGGTPGGANTQVQYNNSGAFGASASFTFDGTTLVSPKFSATSSTSTSANKGAISYGTLGYSDTDVMASFQSSVNGYNQIILQNTNAGSSASTNFNVSNDSSTSSTNYGEFGINSSTYSGSGSFGLAGATYLSSASTDLVVGTYNATAVHFVTNSSATDAMTISSAGAVSTTQTFTAPQVNASNGFHVNSKTVAVSYSIPSGSSAMSAGPITVNSGITVTVPSGSKWVVL